MHRILIALLLTSSCFAAGNRGMFKAPSQHAVHMNHKQKHSKVKTMKPAKKHTRWLKLF